MASQTTIIQSRFNPNLEVSVFSGHFATSHSHNNHYIDITRMKHEHTMAREAAITLSQGYTYDTPIDTIVCMDGSEVIAAFLARHLTKGDLATVNSQKNVCIVTPEYDPNRQMIFRDNLIPMIRGKNILLLISTVNSGRTIRRALDCIHYYNGIVQGIGAVFSAQEEVDGVRVHYLFSPEDIPGYETHSPRDCPLCKAGQRIDALANSFGFSTL